MFGLSHDIGVDLGTANTLVYVRGRGVVLREPSVVAVDRTTGRYLAFGAEARRMLGRTPGNIVASRPLRSGVIADFNATQAMLGYYLGRVRERYSPFRPRVMVCIPSGTTAVEKRAVLEAGQEAGARRVFLIEEPLAAALGAGLDISRPNGSMVVDIGGGTTAVAVFALNGIVLSSSLRIGGDSLDEAIVSFVKHEHSVLIGERSAEDVKLAIGTVRPELTDGTAEVRGRDLISGLPKTVKLTAHDTYVAMERTIKGIVDMVRQVLERTPPELASDIMEQGLVLTGGGALLRGLDSLLASETGVPVVVADDPLSCVALGTGKALESLDTLNGKLISLTSS